MDTDVENLMDWNNFIVFSSLNKQTNNVSFAVGSPPATIRLHSPSLTFTAKDDIRSFVRSMVMLGYNVAISGIFPTYCIIKCRIEKDITYSKFIENLKQENVIADFIPVESIEEIKQRVSYEPILSAR